MPAESDGLSKNGSRANWGVVVSAGGATNAATVVVTPQNCTTLTYTGATSAPHTGSATVSAQLTDLTGGPRRWPDRHLRARRRRHRQRHHQRIRRGSTATLPVQRARRARATITTTLRRQSGGLDRRQ